MMTKTGRIELMSSRLPAPRTSSESPGVGTVETQYTT
ncbi:homoserine dehydrogenase, partial [Pseudomonas sp. FW215-R4]